jgi:HAD superfamily hydrolase (TIGR01549 family)
MYKYSLLSKKPHKMITTFIFDLDGCLLDTQTSFHATAECMVLESYGVFIKPEEISSRFAGIPTRKVFETLLKEHGTSLSESDLTNLLEIKWEIIRRIIDECDFPSSMNLLGTIPLFLKSTGAKLGIASASPRWYIEACCTKVTVDIGIYENLLSVFDVYVSAEEAERPKPFPDVFLECANRLNSEPHECIVIGDGESDLLGGLAAGMKTIFISPEKTLVRPSDMWKQFETHKQAQEFIRNGFNKFSF